MLCTMLYSSRFTLPRGIPNLIYRSYRDLVSSQRSTWVVISSMTMGEAPESKR